MENIQGRFKMQFPYYNCFLAIAKLIVKLHYILLNPKENVAVELKDRDILHCAKSVQIRSIFWSEYRKIWTRKDSVFGHFSHSVDASLILIPRIRYQKNVW